uniref:PH domain-containing protein n=1 Tax=Angiostrongylus cantonensis TaxID=6313 RepID=A0A0K0DDG4_ANGCA
MRGYAKCKNRNVIYMPYKTILKSCSIVIKLCAHFHNVHPYIRCNFQLSAQRTLLLARERLDLLRCEVNRISALSAVRNPPPPVCRELRGTMTISNITVHLNRSFYCSYALLILLKCGTEVEATGPISLFTHHQVRARQLTFGEHVQFANLPVDFNVIVEVYAMKLPISKANEHSCASNIANKCRSLLNPVSYRPNYMSSRNDAQVSEFVRCGYVILNRDTVGTNKFYLDEAEYPLEGTIEVYARCTTLPPAIEVDNRGFLVSYLFIGMASWERYWAVLRRGMVYFWRYPDDESLEKRPIAFMDLSKCTNDVVVACSLEQCPRENSFSIDMLVSTTPSIMEKKRYVFRFCFDILDWLNDVKICHV